MKSVALLLILLAACNSANAESEQGKKSESRLRVFEPNYFVYRWAEDDESALRARFSMAYLTKDFGSNGEYQLLKDSEIYFSYVGEFDFYMGTRDSGPVINRLNNPAVHWRKKLDYLEWVDISLEHKSNGQSTEVKSPREIERVELAYQEKDHNFFDTISRGSDFFAVELNKKFSAHKISVYSKIKLYLDMDTDVTWGKLKGEGVQLSDYDRVTTVIRKKIGDGEVSVDWTLGDKLAKTDSWNLDYLISRKWDIPLYFRVHLGPLYTLSNYTEDEKYFGVGIKLTP